MKRLILFVVVALITLGLSAAEFDWTWAKKAGGTSSDTGNAIAMDAAGNSYISGYFLGTATFGTTNLISSGNGDIFVAKLDPNGIYLWAKRAGGSSEDHGNSIAVDAAGNCYISGYFESTATFGTFNLICSGSCDTFVAKLDTNGNWLWAKKPVCTLYDAGSAIAVDAAGNSYVSGSFTGTATFGTSTLIGSGGFVAKLDTDGNWMWAQNSGGTSSVNCSAIAIDDTGNSYVNGYFYDTATFGTTSLTSSGEDDIFVAKLDAIGNWLWAKQAGGTSEDFGNAIAVDTAGNSYVSGFFNSTATFGTSNLSTSGNSDIFVAKLDAGGNWLWARQAGGTGADVGKGIAADAAGNSYLSGSFIGTATFGTTNLISRGNSDIYVAKLDANGNWRWIKQAGGVSHESAYALTLDARGNCLISGVFIGTSTFGTTNLISSGYVDIFVAKLELKPLELLSPLSGEVWRTGSSKTIYWVPNESITDINILFSWNNGVDWTYLNSTPVSAAQGYYNFTVPALISEQCKIKLESLEFPGSVYDISDVFSISSANVPSVTLTAPTALNQNLQSGRDYPISWSSNLVSIVDLWVSYNNGVLWHSIATNLPASPGIYNWQVPDSPQTTCYIKVTDSSNSLVYDWSDNPFTITSLELVDPQSNSILRNSAAYTVTWQSVNIPTLKLEFSSDSGQAWTTLSSDIPASSGSYIWTPPATPIGTYLLKLSNANDPGIFTQVSVLVMDVELTYPNLSGIRLQSNRTCNITWTPINISALLKLEYSSDGGSIYSEIISGLNPLSGSYLWLVPDINTTTAKVRISVAENSAINDESDNDFTICKVELLTPNGGEVWGSNTVKTITWSSYNITNVRLRYSINNGANWQTIITSTPAASGSYNWTIPSGNFAQCKVRIVDATETPIQDESDSPFTIRPQITVLAPNGGETCTINQVLPITWTVTPDVAQVYLDYSVNGGTDWLPVNTSVINATIGVFNWLVPAVESTQALIQIRKSTDSGIFDVSDGVFTISPLINPPVANFSADVTTGLEPLEVQFTDLSVAGSGTISSYLWSFGDGGNSVEQNPLYTYLNSGVFSVSLQVTNEYDSTNTFVRQDYITVNPRYPVLELQGSNNLNLGSTFVEEAAEYQQIVIRNTGTADLTLSSIYLSGGENFEFYRAQPGQPILPNMEEIIFARFTPHTVGTLIDTLCVVNNSTNQPLLQINLSGIGLYVPPLNPEQVNITMDGYNALLTWDAVIENTHYQPLIPDYYFIYFNGSPNPEGLFYFLGMSPTNQFTHTNVAMGAEYMFYHVRAIKLYRPVRGEALNLPPEDTEQHLKQVLKTGMTETEVSDILYHFFDDLR